MDGSRPAQTYAMPVYHDGHLYGMNGRTVLTCVDAETGEMKWRNREPGDGFPTLVGDQIVFVTKAQTLHVGPASPQGWKERARLDLFDDLSWTAPSVAGDAVFARSLGELARVDWKTEPASPTAAATPAADNQIADAGTLPRGARACPRQGGRGRPLPGRRRRTDRSIDPPDRVVFLYRGPAKDVAIASDLLGIRREDPMTGCPAQNLFYYEARVESASRVSYQFIPDFGGPVPDAPTHAACPAPGRTRGLVAGHASVGCSEKPRAWGSRQRRSTAAWTGDPGSRARPRKSTRPSRSREESFPLIDGRFARLPTQVREPSSAGRRCCDSDRAAAFAGAWAVRALSASSMPRSSSTSSRTPSSGRFVRARASRLRVYRDWGLYGHASTREARVAGALRAANHRFNENSARRATSPPEARPRTATGGQARATGPTGCSRRCFRRPPRSLGEERRPRGWLVSEPPGQALLPRTSAPSVGARRRR